VFQKLYNKLHNELQTYWMNWDRKPLGGEYWVEIEGNRDGWAGWSSQAQRKGYWIRGTAGTVWRHPIGRQVPHQRYVLFCSRQTLFFVLFAQQEPSGG